MKGVSLVICCYNSAQRLPDTLSYVAKLNLQDIELELIIVDNASKDNTSDVAAVEWSKYSVPHIQFKVVKEPIPGLISARKRGIQEAKFDYILFCDDDNWLDGQFIVKAFGLIEKFPNAAVLGGDGTPVFEDRNKPEWFDFYQGIYAVGKQAESEGIVNVSRGFVFGASSFWKKSVLKQIVANDLVLTGRIGSKLSSSEDVELCFHAILLGYDIVYSPVLKFSHFIPSSRVTMAYVERFISDSLPQSFNLHGLKYKAGVTPEMFNSKIKRTWWGQMIILLKNQLSSKGFPIPVVMAQIIALLKLNIKYDRSFSK